MIPAEIMLSQRLVMSSLAFSISKPMMTEARSMDGEQETRELGLKTRAEIWGAGAGD